MKKNLLLIVVIFLSFSLKAQDQKLEKYRQLLDRDKIDFFVSSDEQLNNSEEIKTERTQTALVFSVSDTKRTSIISAGLMNYFENQEWKLVHNNFIPYASKSKYSHSSPFNENKIYLGSTDNSILLASKEEAFVFGKERTFKIINGNTPVVEKTAALNADFQPINFQGNPSILYPNIFQDIDSRYIRLTNGFKQEYVIKNASVINYAFSEIQFSEKIEIPKNYIIEKELNGDIENLVIVSKDRSQIIVLSPLLLYDKNNSKTYGKYAIKNLGNQVYELTYSVSSQWLTDSTRVFPIVVDPSVSIETTNSTWWTGTVDEDGGTLNPEHCTSGEMLVGFEDGGTGNDMYHATVKFDLGIIPDNACVYNTNLNLYQQAFVNGRNDDNDLKFTIGTSSADPVSSSCPAIYNAIEAGTKFEAWDVWGSAWSGPAGSVGNNDYNENTNGWKSFLNYGNNTTAQNYDTYVQNALASDDLIFGLDFYSEGHSDPIFFDNNEWINFAGFNSSNRPYVVVNYDLPITITQQPTGATKCVGENVSFTTAATGGGAYNYQWQFDGSGSFVNIAGATSSTYTIASIATTNDGNYRCVVSNFCGSATTVNANLIVNTSSLPPTSITGIATICAGASTTLTVSGGSLGTGSNYAWYSGSCTGTAVGTGNTLLVSPAVTTTYYAKIEGHCSTTSCISQTVTVETASMAPGSITATQATICAGTPLTLSVNGGLLGTAAAWTWYSASCGGTPVGTGSSISVSPTANTTYFVRAEGSCNTTTCASTAITVNSLSLIPTGISSAGDTICHGNATMLSVDGGALGTGATWQWYTNSCGGISAGTGNSIAVSPTATTTYYLRAEGTCNTTTPCVTKTITVSQNPVEPNAPNVTHCESLPTTLNATGNGGTIKWYVTNISNPEISTGNNLSLGTLSAGTYFRYVTETNAFACESSRKEVEIVIKPMPSDAPVAADATICPGTSASLLATNAGAATVPANNFKWFNAPNLATVVYTGAIYNTPNLITPPAAHTFYVAGVLDGCIGDTTAVTVDFHVADMPVVSNDTAVCNGDLLTLYATAPTSIEIRWYANGDLSGYIQSGSSFTTPALNSNTTYYATAVYANACESQPESVLISINPLALSPVLTDEVYCQGDDVILNATNSNGTLTWYADAALSTIVGTGSPLNLGALPADTLNYFAQVNNGTCVSAVVANTVTIDALPAAPTVTAPTICEGEQATITVTSAHTVNWYADAALSNLVFVGSTFTSPVLNANTTYYVTNENATACQSASSTVLVTVNPKPAAPTAAGVTVCKNESATLTASGGAASFIWYADAALTNQVGTGASFTTPNLNANTSYFVLENNGFCLSNATQVNVLINLDIVIEIDSITDVLCNGSSTGSIYTTVSGGTGAYTYVWTGGTANEDLTNTTAGNYVLTVTDALGCSASNNASISSPDALVVSLDNVNDVSCNGAADGSIEVTIAGGTSAYTYVWNNGTANIATTKNLYNQSAGTYTLTVADANGCIETLMATVNENAALTASISTNNILCFGGTSSATVTAAGGSGTYTYLWSGFQNTASVSGLSVGAISVIVTDSKGCSVQVFDNITSPTAALSITEIAHTDVSCFNGNNGLINTNITGGTTPYTISWSSGGTNLPGISNLSAGFYTITVTDANGCIETATYEIKNALEIVATMAVSNPSCFGEETGMIVVGNSGGTAPYTYAWNTTPPQSGVVAVNLAGDASYTVSITDINGCTKQETAAVINPTEMTVTTIPTSVSCISTANGRVSVAVSNGNAPFQYELNGFLQADSVFDHLDGGNYVVFVEDNNNCVASASFEVNTISAMEAELEAAGNNLNFVTENLYIVRGEEVSLNLNLINDNGNSIVAYNWNPSTIDTSNSISNPSFFPNENITVFVEVLEDINGTVCSVFDTLTIDVSQEKISFIPTAFSPNSSGANNYFEMNVLGAENLDVKIFNRWGELVFANANQGNGPSDVNDLSLMDGTNPRGAWNGKYKGEDVPTGAYAYTVEVTYFDGSKEVLSGSVTIIR